MRKKLLIVWVVIIAGLFAWTSLRRQEIESTKVKDKITSAKDLTSSPKADTNQSSDRADPFPVDNQKDLSTSQLADIKDPTISPEKLIEKWENQTDLLVENLLQDSKRLTTCLLKDLCGEKPSNDSPYFDKNNTPSHSLLEHELTALIFLQEANNFDAQILPKLELERMLNIENEAIQRMALELRLSAGIDDQVFNDLLNKSPSLLPQASANSLVMLSKESRKSQGRRDQFINIAESILKSKDQNKAIEMAKRVQYFDVDKTEIERLANSTCQLLPQNKKAARYHLLIAAEAVGANLNFNCSSN